MAKNYIAEAKAALAKKGASLDASARISLVNRPPHGTQANIVVLERVGDTKPDYCTHGYAQCIDCFEFCWLGHNTEQAVIRGVALPVCRECAARIIPRDSKPIVNLQDHKRADGPHG